MTKRITIPIDDNLNAIKAKVEEELGIAMSYAQVVAFLAKFYRKHIPVKSNWRSN